MNNEINDDYKEFLHLDVLTRKDKIKKVREETTYLDNITDNDIDNIIFTCYKDIIILLTNHKLMMNGNIIFEDAISIGFSNGGFLYVIREHNKFSSLFVSNKDAEYLNRKDYQYKKIICTALSVLLLTEEQELIFFGTIMDSVVNYRKMFNVKDIGITEDGLSYIINQEEKMYYLFSEDIISENYIMNDNYKTEQFEIYTRK